ncbi:MAG: response regulator [Oxalobacteraceae bacterium]|nr:MAG: response regulator [Oxalobacteraceae bacterium]
MNIDKPLPADVVAIPVREHDDATAAELYDFVENAVEGLHRVGPDGTILWANRAELQMLGYGWEDYVGRHIADFHEDPATIDFILRTLLAGEALYDQPARLRCKDGSIRHVLIHSNGHFVDGQLRYTRCFTRDASERHERDQALAQRDAMLMAAQVAAALLMGPELRFRLVNNRYRDLIDTSSMLGQTFDEAFPHLGDAGVAEAVARVYASGVSYQAEELSVTRPDAEGQPVERFFKFSLEPLLDLDGRPEGVIVVAVDVTEHVRNRLAIEHAAREREQLLVDLGAASQAKDEFLAMLGHELRNPLSAISSASSLLGMHGVGAESSGRARMIIQRQTQHLSRIVDDLLDLSRAMSGKILLSRKRLDLATLVSGCLDTFRATGRTAGYTISTDLQPGWVDGDATRLEQIATNLIDNALKYTPNGGKIDIGINAEDGDIVLTVRDSGVGIAPDLLPHVFDVFVQGAISIDRSQGGLGIGLSLVRRLVELHGGAVNASSEGNSSGSTFQIRLPHADAEATHEEPAGSASTGGQQTILLIEDNDDGREMMATMLESFGYPVFQARDGLEGVRIAADKLPDVALVDIGLPGIDGYEVARRLRAEPQTREIRLIALTGYGLAEDQQRVLDAGFDLHLVKPVELEALLEQLVEPAGQATS